MVLRAQTDSPPESKDSCTRSSPKVGISWLDKLGLTRMVDADAIGPLFAWVNDSASALAGNDREGARNRLLARLIAETRATHALLEAMFVERLRERDHEGVGLARKALAGCHSRLLSLLQEHRLSTEGERRAGLVGIAHADNVSFTAK